MTNGSQTSTASAVPSAAAATYNDVRPHSALGHQRVSGRLRGPPHRNDNDNPSREVEAPQSDRHKLAVEPTRGEGLVSSGGRVASNRRYYRSEMLSKIC